MGEIDRDFFVGLDLGQSADYTAVVVAERLVPYDDQGSVEDSLYQVRHIQRLQLGTSYPAVAETVRGIVRTPELRGRSTLVVDQTGVGAPVVDLLLAAQLDCGLVAVTITGGDVVTHEGGNWRVPKRDLVSTAKVLLQGDRVRFAERLPETKTLVNELLNFQVKIDPVTAHDSYASWREGVHDDLVLALCLALWYGEQGAGWLVF